MDRQAHALLRRRFDVKHSSPPFPLRVIFSLSNEAKTKVIAPAVGSLKNVTVGTSHGRRFAVPAAAASNAFGPEGLMERVFRGKVFIGVFLVIVVDPFPHISQHVMEPEVVGFVVARWGSENKAVLTGHDHPGWKAFLGCEVRSVGKRAPVIFDTPPKPCRGRARSAGILPFCLRGQTIISLAFCGEPSGHGARIVPGNVNNRVCFTLLESGSGPVDSRPGNPVSSIHP